jgi:DNA-binding NtrC family response regulator
MKKKVFIVDDDAMMTQMLKDHLLQNPLYDIDTFGTGEECLRNLDQDPIAIILDYKLNMHDPAAANGLEILQQIKNIKERTCVIMLSSQEQYGTALKTIAKGALEYVVKDNDAFRKVGKILSSLD